MSAVVEEWRQFRDDTPGERFEHHHDRMKQGGTRAGAVARMVAGIALIAGGIIMLFIPGPGFIALLFGFGLLGGQSKPIARALDKVEPAVRDRGRRAMRWFKALSAPARIALVAVASLGCAVAGYLAWAWIT